MDSKLTMTEEELNNERRWITEDKFDKGFICEGERDVLIVQPLNEKLYRINSIYRIK